jgi:hypothetical protein
MKRGTTARDNPPKQENSTVQDMDRMEIGWMSLQLQVLLHLRCTNANQSYTR